MLPLSSTFRQSVHPADGRMEASTFAARQHQQQQQQQQPRHHQPPQQQAHISAAKARQYAALQAQLAQLNVNLADTEQLVRMTAIQAGDLRFLGGYMGALFMGAAKVLGEEGVAAGNQPDQQTAGASPE
ncbi:hypothetical protein KEM52_002509 [Ascosphaera acerosa]|nr:hypothetical protein KEM52_002509 [Ascosphaera acerosa]